MDIEGLRSYLKNEHTYQEASKTTFLEKVENLFETLKSLGDQHLKLYPGECGGKECDNCGKKGYRFVGDISGNYIDFIFEMKENEITDIYCCSEFLAGEDHPGLGTRKNFYIDVDERASFPRTAEYWRRVHAAQDAYNEMITRPPRILSIEEIEYWLTKYSELYEKLGRYKLLSSNVKWSPFLRLYNDLEEIKIALSDKMNRLIQANLEFRAISSEKEQIDWIIKFEDIYHTGTLELWFFFVKHGDNFGFAEFEDYFFSGALFAEAYSFFNAYTNPHIELLEKYSVFTSDEEDEFNKKEEWCENDNESSHLSFHINKRKQLEELGIYLPFFMQNKGIADEKIPF